MSSPVQIARDLALLVARLGLGVILIAHGWQKLSDQGLAGTAAGFGQMGVPLPTVSAYYATFVELVGGVALILGLALPLVGLLVALDMAGALVLVHLPNGLFASQGGFELVLAIGVGAVAIAAAGSGRLGLDHYLLRRRSKLGEEQGVSA
ncbi:DoxX family protein [Tenggerimyces flavus]|uniref:DoxX family protein n=1 Tax=Tenggerimyces flavus TaxID=1708749 RepID=A0ABV7YP14_9ACTN|nr:DoxX family protein [Tenggerimyces flavus]MBM7784927.1 putative oxidoreductase [Tenggerimyces flavus]